MDEWASGSVEEVCRRNVLSGGMGRICGSRMRGKSRLFPWVSRRWLGRRRDLRT